MKLPEIDAKSFAKHILRTGTKEEKRELLSCINAEIVLEDRRLFLEKTSND